MASGLYVCVTRCDRCDGGGGGNQCLAGRKGLCFSTVSLHATMKETKMRIRVVVSTKKEKTSVCKF